MKKTRILTVDTPINESVFVYKKAFHFFCKKFGITQKILESYSKMFATSFDFLRKKGININELNPYNIDSYSKRYHIIKSIACVNSDVDFNHYNFFSYKFGSSSKFENPLKYFSQKKEKINKFINIIKQYIDSSSATFITINNLDLASLKKDKEKLLLTLKKKHKGAYMRGYETIDGEHPHYHILFVSPDSQNKVIQSVKSFKKTKGTNIDGDGCYKKNSEYKQDWSSLGIYGKIAVIGNIYDYITKIGKTKKGEKFATLTIQNKLNNISSKNKCDITVREFGMSLDFCNKKLNMIELLHFFEYKKIKNTLPIFSIFLDFLIFVTKKTIKFFIYFFDYFGFSFYF